MTSAKSSVQTVRLGGGEGKGPPAVLRESFEWRRTALLQEHTAGNKRPPYVPSGLSTFRILILIRMTAAMYSIILDCDESYNYWEALHLLSWPTGSSTLPEPSFQTWEYSPVYAIRSYAYLLQYLPYSRWLPQLFSLEKRQAFFAVRIALAITCAACEALFASAVSEAISQRVGKYLIVILATSAGLWQSSASLLPSTFSMYTTMAAFSFAMYPSRLSSSYAIPSKDLPRTPRNRTFAATSIFALGAILGWPFALVLAVPFVLEECILASGDEVRKSLRWAWLSARASRWMQSVLMAALIALPVTFIDSIAYGRIVLVPLNIIRYNVLSDAGPDLYGTEAMGYYVLNLALAFNIVSLLALLSAPIFVLSIWLDPRRSAHKKPAAETKGHTSVPVSSSPRVLLATRLAPFYLWFFLLSSQAHKEERFMFPAYALLCFNAAVALYLLRGIFESIFTTITKSPYRASRSHLFSYFTLLTLVVSSVLSLLRILALVHYYRAPFSALHHLETEELPIVVSQLYPHTLSAAVRTRVEAGLPPKIPAEEQRGQQEKRQDRLPGDQSMHISLAPIQQRDGVDPLRLCVGKEWYRFPTHFLVPRGVRVEFVRSAFDGILPAHFRSIADESAEPVYKTPPYWPTWKWSKATRVDGGAFNDLNKEEADRYVDYASCDYLLDVDFAHRFAAGDSPNPREPRTVPDTQTWEPLFCAPLLDNGFSHPVGRSGILWKLRSTLARTLYLPGEWWQRTNAFGDYCLLRRRVTEGEASRTRR